MLIWSRSTEKKLNEFNWKDSTVHKRNHINDKIINLKYFHKFESLNNIKYNMYNYAK